MPEKKPPTHYAYWLKRVSENNAIILLEIGTATEHADNRGFDIQLDRLPVGGFNGFIRIRPMREKQSAVQPPEDDL